MPALCTECEQTISGSSTYIIIVTNVPRYFAISYQYSPLFCVINITCTFVCTTAIQIPIPTFFENAN